MRGGMDECGPTGVDDGMRSLSQSADDTLSAR